jgi:hypothetical protein
LGLRGTRKQGSGEDYITRSFMHCTLRTRSKDGFGKKNKISAGGKTRRRKKKR